MRLPRFQFTIRHSIVVIAILAVCCAVLRSPFAFVVVLVGGALPGYVIGRVRGGAGIIAGALSESACAALLFIGSLLSYKVPISSSPVEAIVSLFPLACIIAVLGFILGLVISSGLYVLAQMTNHLFEMKSNEEAQEEIRWLHDGQQQIR